METEYDYVFMIVLIGDSGVGKASIFRRYKDGIFTSPGITTIGVDFCIKTLQIASSAVKLQIWNIGAQERLRTMNAQMFYRSADAIVMVYDIGSMESFRNKNDRPDRKIDTTTGEQFAHENGMPFLETSAKNSSNIDKLFLELAKTLQESHVDKRLKTQHSASGYGTKPNTISLTESAKKLEQAGRGGCC